MTKNTLGVNCLFALAAIVLIIGTSCSSSGGDDGGDTTADISPPAVSSVSPVDDAVDIPTTAVIAVGFSEAMNQTAAQGAFSVSPSVAGAFSWNMNTMTFDPTGALAGSTLYTCTVSTAAKDSAGNAMAAQYQWGFTTAAGTTTLNPTLVGSCTLGAAQTVYVAGNYAYVADLTWGFMIVDISNPAAPNVVGYDTSTFQANAVFAAGSYAYVIDGSNNLRIYDITDKVNPVRKNATNPWGSRNVYVAGSYAYVPTSGGLKIIDVADPVNPALYGSCDTSGNFRNISVVGSYAYIADANDPGEGMKIIDITNPAGPTLAGSYSPLGSVAKDVYVVGNYAYVPDGTGKLEIVDISNPASPALIGSCDPGGFANTVRVAGNYAYVILDGGQMKIIDISVPAAPVLAGSYASGQGRGVCVAGSYAYIADQASGLLIIGGIGQ